MTSTRPGIGPRPKPGTSVGPGPTRSRIAEAEAHAKRMVANWYADAERGGDELMAPMEDNDGVHDDEISEGIVDTWDDDLPELPRETDPEHRRARWTPSPHIVFYRSAGVITWDIQAIPESMYEDPLLLANALAHAERLERIAATLAIVQREALLSSTFADAVYNLAYLTKTRIAEAAGVESKTGSKISNDRHKVIEAPFGRVTLDVFTWASQKNWQGRVDAIQILDGLLRDDPGVSANAAGEIAARKTGMSPEIRKHVPALKNVHRHPGIVAEHRNSFPQTSWQRLRDAVGSNGDTRAKPVMCLALTGTIGLHSMIGETE